VLFPGLMEHFGLQLSIGQAAAMVCIERVRTIGA
ncbi:hypothetical protein Tco_0103354, partial [Tanacetum coccineum]